MFSQIQLLHIKNMAMRILHVPGNYSGGILEMAIVADYHISCEELKERCAQIAGALKQTDEVFRNVRVNLIKWISDEAIVKEISSLPVLQMGRAFEDYGQYEVATEQRKTMDELFRQLKLFYARSKLIIVLTDGEFEIAETEKVKQYLNPFLKRKILLLKPKGDVHFGENIKMMEWEK